ncbi:MAG TPA: HDOD domain-containing protein [Candidatus Hydrogenedentes bacterium]|nr:HDOD domain-containing protein [Candidatus Hydrogenedentota bacterium]HPG65332.1 HDOD domain-containing protein [Candidatus Hydrogenedentota bacterium]
MPMPDVRDTMARIRELPTLPAVLAQVFATVADPDASALDLGKHITADQSLSARLLKLVNSAHYGFYRQIDNVTTAIVVLGFVEVRNLVLAASAFRTLSSGRSQRARTELWRHALASAMASERVCKVCAIKMEESYVCGLLHDIGKVVLDAVQPEAFQLAADRAREQHRLIRETEQDVFGIDHAEAGGILSEHWNLPPTVVQGIRLHHSTESGERGSRQADMAAVANYVAQLSGVGSSGNGCPCPRPIQACARIGVDEQKEEQIGRELVDKADRISEILGVLSH